MVFCDKNQGFFGVAMYVRSHTAFGTAPSTAPSAGSRDGRSAYADEAEVFEGMGISGRR